MSQEDFERRVGSWLRKKWRLERLIGVGGMAAVYAAEHKIGRKAAIKILHPEFAHDPQVRERFEQEAYAVNSVGHPGVVQVLDVDESERGELFLVMELLEGETVADWVEREGRPPDKALLDMVDEVLDVLVACHRKGIVHRDIKPENVFLQKSGPIKVLDFGIARVRAGLVKTRAGTMLGTVAFMPPEQLRGVGVDHRVDLFAVGAMMFTILAGRRVHMAPDDAELARKVLTEPAPPLASVADVPESFALVVDRALAFLPDRRYPDAQTMRGDIWALEKKQRPPYAFACDRAGQDPHVTKEPPTKPSPTNPGDQVSSNKKEAAIPTPPDAAVPSTDPQMPTFEAKLPGTDPQMPAFDDDGAISSTRPAMPVLEGEESDDDGDLAAQSDEAPQEGGAKRTLFGLGPGDDEEDDEAPRPEEVDDGQVEEGDEEVAQGAEDDDEQHDGGSPGDDEAVDADEGDEAHEHEGEVDDDGSGDEDDEAPENENAEPAPPSAGGGASAWRGLLLVALVAVVAGLGYGLSTGHLVWPWEWSGWDKVRPKAAPAPADGPAPSPSAADTATAP